MSIKKKITLLACICAAAAITIVGCGSKKSLELSDYITISYDGVNGEGTAYADIDFLQMETDYADGDQYSDSMLEKMITFSGFEDSINVEVENAEGLSNGDEITVTIFYDNDAAKNAGVSVSGDSATFTVEGLPEIETVEIDPFDEEIFGSEGGVNVKFYGYSPFLSDPSITVPSELPEPYNNITYSVDWNAVVENGDTITVTAELSESGKDVVGENGDMIEYVLEPESKDVVIEGYPSYITSFSEIEDSELQSFKDVLQNTWSDEYDVEFINSNGESQSFTIKGSNYYDGKIDIDDEMILVEPIDLDPTSYIAIIPFKTHVSRTHDDPRNKYMDEIDTDIYGYFTVEDFILNEEGKIEDCYKIHVSGTMGYSLDEHCFTTREEMMQEINDNYTVVNQ